jgi:2,3-bisphosphoglycerate-independent phosphoglycerate mutase
MGKHKGMMLVLDGIGDRPCESLGGLTPLEAANTPNLDSLADRGSSGFVSALQPWVPVGTQTGLGMLMGLAREDVRRLTRGPVEAAGAGMDLASGDIAIRCNLATLKKTADGFDIIDRRAGRVSEEVAELLDPLNDSELADGVRLFVAQSTHHRAVAILRGTDLSPDITDTDPGAGRVESGVLECQPRQLSEAAARTARLVNQLIAFSYDELEGHPLNRRRAASGLPAANGLITRGAGGVFESRNLVSHLGLKAAIVTGEGTAVGLARIFGFDAIIDDRFTAGISTDLGAKIAAAIGALETHDFVFVHIKGTDVASHDKNPVAKKQLIERIDESIAPLLDMDLVIGVTGDHSTDSNSGRHTGDPVPALLTGPNMRRDPGSSFSESACRTGGLGHLPATSFLCGCLDMMNAMHNHRAYEYFFYS